MSNCWQEKELGRVADVVMGQSPPSSTYNFTGAGLPFLQGKAEFGAVHPSPVKSCSRPLKVAPKGSVLVSVRAPVGDANIADRDYCIGRGLAAVVPGKNLDGWFLFAWLTLKKAELEALGTGTTFKSVNKRALNDFPVPFPSLAEQRAIAKVLRAVQQAKQATEKVIAATKELKKSLMCHIFTYGPVPIDKADKTELQETHIGYCPREWTPARFDEFIVLQRGFDITKKEQRPGDVPVISSSGITSYHDTPKVEGPGVVIGRKGSLGTVYYIDCDFWPHDTTLWVTDFKGNDPKYVSFFLPRLRLESLDTGTSNPTLNRNYVHALKVAFPSVKEQRQIADQLSAVDSKLAKEEVQRAALENLFKSLLHHMMSGKVRLPEFAGAA